MMYRFILLLAVFQACSALPLEQTKFMDCGSKGTLLGVEIEPCDTEPCTLYKGQKAQIKLKFKTPTSMIDGHAEVHGVISHIPVPFPLDNNDVCTFTTAHCQQQTEESVMEYTYALPILLAYPSIHLNVKWELKDAGGETQICALMPVQIDSK